MQKPGKRNVSLSKGRIADIQRASVDDGAGLRTTVFFKGCPLRCAWCHNPECLSEETQELFYPEKCIGCGQCRKGCYAGARVICGRDYTVEALLKEIVSDRAYYGDRGGVTFSGGEPLMQLDFLREITGACRREGIGCAVETSLFRFDEGLFREMDFVMADFKLWQDTLHQKYTGVSNRDIKRNFEKLNALEVPIIARTPVIPGIEQGIAEISAFLKGLSHVVQYELLPYHPLGNTKRKALGLPEDGFRVPTRQEMEELKGYAFLRGSVKGDA